MAATLKLEGNLRDAIDMNLMGTQRALNVAKEMKQLEAFVHLSTAFCNCDQEVMYEKVYDFPHKPEDLMRLAEWMDVKTLDAITPDLLKPHPNTYTYSKRLAELLVRDHYETMPVIIARPSIGKSSRYKLCLHISRFIYSCITLIVGRRLEACLCCLVACFLNHLLKSSFYHKYVLSIFVFPNFTNLCFFFVFVLSAAGY